MNKISCLIWLIIVGVNVTLGAMSVDYILFWLGKDIPFLADAAIGLFAGEITIPIAVIGWILKCFGVF